jgi:hypothetical protein
LLKAKALASLRRCARAFNDFDDDGRVSTVLLHLQHAFEMLLKASLMEKDVRVFDRRKGRSIGFDKSVSIGAEVSVTEKDVNRVEKAIKANRPRPEVFPRLGGLGASIEGSGVTINVKFSKREGAPVRFIAADDPREAAAVREVDLQRKYRHSARDLHREPGRRRGCARRARGERGLINARSRDRGKARRDGAAGRGRSLMRAAVMYAPGDVRVEDREEPRLVEATDAIIRVSAACVCGSDLWPYHGVEDLAWPAAMGHEYVGVVE